MLSVTSRIKNIVYVEVANPIQMIPQLTAQAGHNVNYNTVLNFNVTAQ